MQTNRTRFSAMIALILLGALATAPAYASGLLSLPALRESAPPLWQQSYTTEGGNQVDIEVDIDIPHADTFPILRVREGNTAYKPQAGGDETLVIYPRTASGAFRVFRDPPDGMWNARGERENKPEWKNAGTQSIYWFRPWQWTRAYAEENPLALREAVDIAQQELQQITGQQVTFSPDRVTTRMVFQGESWLTQKPEDSTLLGKGYYAIDFVQILQGIPLLGNAHTLGLDIAENMPPPPHPWVGTAAETTVASSGEYNVAAMVHEVIGTVHEDVRLCSFDVIKESVERLIGQGHLRGINSLRLGYALFADPAGGPHGLTFPVWVVKGDWYENPEDKSHGYHTFTPAGDGYIGFADMVATPLMFNAQTGELMRGTVKPKQLFMPPVVTQAQ